LNISILYDIIKEKKERKNMATKQTLMVKKYLKEIGFGNVRVKKGNDAFADMLSNTIYFDTKWYNKKNADLKLYSKAIKNYYDKKLNHKIKISMATYTLFHELGHLISMKDYEDKDFMKAYGQYTKGVNKITTKSIQKNINQYRKLKLERLADKYGYAIYLLNENSAIQFDKKMRKQFA
jgi:Zn-dependent peptidase ImmA (M78 family)